MAELKFKIGDRVIANGTLYQSANGTLTAGSIAAKITYIDKTASAAAHPYNLHGVTGWLDEKSLKKYVAPPFKIGDKVMLKKAVTYSGKPFKSWYNTYEVLAMEQDKITIGRQETIVAVVNADNVRKA